MLKFTDLIVIRAVLCSFVLHSFLFTSAEKNSGAQFWVLVVRDCDCLGTLVVTMNVLQSGRHLLQCLRYLLPPSSECMNNTSKKQAASKENSTW
jgi:hypothetical protein